MKETIAIVSCCFNEAENIPTLYDELAHIFSIHNHEFDWHLTIVDDGSEDNTISVINDLISQSCNIELIQLSRNFGKEAAITAGLDYSKNCHVLLIDADLQHPTNIISSMIDKLKIGYDMVVGIPSNRYPSKLQRLFSYLFHRIITISNKSPIIIGAGDFRLIHKRNVSELIRLREKTRYMKGLYGYVGGKVSTVNFKEQDRHQGKTKFFYWQRISLAINGITSTTTLPIRLFTFAGCTVLVFSLLYLLYILFEIIIYDKSVPGFASLLFATVILNGLILIQVGVQGEYISKLLEETKARPIYIVKKHTKMLEKTMKNDSFK